MARNDANRQRAFSDVISIDAWHEKFSPDKATVDLHADVVFGTARLGGETKSKVRFRLSIKRAELVVLVPHFEPFGIDKHSVARTDPGTKMTRSLQQVTEVNASIDGSVKAEIGIRGPSASLDMQAQAGAKGKITEELKGSEDVVSIKVTHRYHNVEKNHRWIFEPGIDPFLSGSPWNAVTSPLLTLVDHRKNRKGPLEPSVRIEIRCLREDLVITGIEIKEEGFWHRIVNREGISNRTKAAEAYIKKQLEELGLEAGNLSDKFANITLAQIVANNGRIS